MNTITTTLAKNPEYYEETISLIEKSFSYTQDNHFEIDFAPLVSPLNYENLHILIKDDQVIGHIGVKLRKFGDQSNHSLVALIGGVALAEDYRGQGLFKPFFKSIIDLYNDSVSLFLLWSDLESLYKKFSFFQVGGQIQTGQQHLIKESVNNTFEIKKVNELTSNEFKKIKELYFLDINNYFNSFLRNENDWSSIKEITSTDYFLYKENKEILGYFCVNKGQDLGGVIHELAVLPKYKKSLLDKIGQFKLWLPYNDQHDFNVSQILFSCFMKIGNPILFYEFIHKMFQDDLIITQIRNEIIDFSFKNESFQLSKEDFLVSIFGPSQIEEFTPYVKPLYIPGLDSI